MANSKNLPIYHGCDAHLLKEMFNVIVEIDYISDEKGLRESLISSKCLSESPNQALLLSIRFSQLTKGIKKLNLRIFFRNFVGIIKQIITLNINQKV